MKRNQISQQTQTLPGNALPDFIAKPDPNRYYSENYIVLDFEVAVMDGRFGSALDPRNHLALACWYDNLDGRLRHSWGSEYRQSALAERLKTVDFFVAHNAKYELGWLSRCGVSSDRLLCFDTMLGEYVLLGNLAAGDPDNGVRRVSLSLDNCGIRRALLPKDPIVNIWMEHGINVQDMPRMWVQARCYQDVQTCRSIFLDQRDRLNRSNRLGVLYTRCALAPVLADIETNGVHLDKERVRAVTGDYREHLHVLEERFTDLTGGINFRSPKQVAGYLYDTLGFAESRNRDGSPKRTATGGRLANKQIISTLRANTDNQRSFLALKSDIGKVSSALSKNLEYFQEICEQRDGTFHAEFNQAVTATHRLSSTGIKEVSSKSVQLTNVPRDFKRLFRARQAGWLIGEADGAQLEFRVAAFLGNDKQARADIADRTFDVHCVSAGAMTGRPYEELRRAYLAGEKSASNARQVAKSDTFKPLYGGSKGTREQEKWYAAFKKRYPELNKTQNDWVYEVLSSGTLITAWGMRYYFPTARVSSSGYVNVGSTVFNYPIQALATAEIIPIAITHFWHRIRAERLEDYIIPVNTIHDSLVCEIHPEYVDAFKTIACDSFGPAVLRYLRTVYKMVFDVPLGTGIKIGTHWGEAVEELYECVNGITERVK